VDKYGVACGCKTGNPDPSTMTKTADGGHQCPQCGAKYAGLKLKDQVKIEDRGIKPQGEKK
jgi:hypothetical protein